MKTRKTIFSRNRIGKLFNPHSAVIPRMAAQRAPACLSRKNSQRGDVLMEYVILLACLVPVLVGVQSVFPPDGTPYATLLFNPNGDHENDFGLVGQAFHSSYTNIVVGVSQPVP
jgi:hypothetical protein